MGNDKSSQTQMFFIYHLFITLGNAKFVETFKKNKVALFDQKIIKEVADHVGRA